MSDTVWQTMDTAPKDGTTFTAWDGVYTDIAYWSSDIGSWIDVHDHDEHDYELWTAHPLHGWPQSGSVK